MKLEIRLRPATIVVLALSLEPAWAQSDYPYGRWLKSEGQTIEIKPGEFGTVQIVLSDHGLASALPCIGAGANFCISGQSLSCSYLVQLSTTGVMNLRFRDGNNEDACRNYAGNYNRQR
jgi:hypothetical protein